MNDFMLLAGTSNPGLAKKISTNLSTKLASIEIRRFSDGESYINIKDSVRNKHVYVIQSGSSPANEHFFEALQIIDASRRLGAQNITAVFPFLPYRRHERAVEKGECVSANLVARLTESAGATAIITCNLHSPHIKTFYHIPVVNISPWGTFSDTLKSVIEDPSTFKVVAPDTGSVEDSSLVSKKLGIPLVLAEKSRPSHDTVKVRCVDGDVKDKNVIMIDDEINTAGTVTSVAEALIELGAIDIYLAATHPVLSGPAIKRIASSPLKKVFVSDTIQLQENTETDKISVVSMAHVISAAIKNELSTQNK